MTFKIGDKVIHPAYGLGEIIHIEEKLIRDELRNCYVVQTPELTVWIPLNSAQQPGLRLPTSADEFTKMCAILNSPGEALPEDRAMRRDFLMTQMNDGQLSSICQVVRDLTNLKRKAKLNDQEKSILDHAMKSLLTEWIYSLKVPTNQAQQAIAKLLEG